MRHLELAEKRAAAAAAAAACVSLSRSFDRCEEGKKTPQRKIQSQRGEGSEDGRLINMREDDDLTGKKVKAEYFKRAPSS